jgi:NAD(P)-dependent dehydrogenase (short-subunit alcohol dehydrogenase family)
VTSAITSGSLDILIANAGLVSAWSGYESLSVLGQDPDHLTRDLNETFNTNVVGNVHLYNLFMPLILKGSIKKVVVLSSGMADTELHIKYGIYEGAPYCISKVAMNMVTAKFQAEYEKDGVLFMGISPGVVDTGNMGIRMFSHTTRGGYDRVLTDEIATEEDIRKLAIMGGKFMKYAPHFTGPIKPEESVKAMMDVIGKASLANGDAGAFVSHFGNKQWL